VWAREEAPCAGARGRTTCSLLATALSAHGVLRGAAEQTHEPRTISAGVARVREQRRVIVHGGQLGGRGQPGGQPARLEPAGQPDPSRRGAPLAACCALAAPRPMQHRRAVRRLLGPFCSRAPAPCARRPHRRRCRLLRRRRRRALRLRRAARAAAGRPRRARRRRLGRQRCRAGCRARGRGGAGRCRAGQGGRRRGRRAGARRGGRRRRARGGGRR